MTRRDAAKLRGLIEAYAGAVRDTCYEESSAATCRVPPGREEAEQEKRVKESLLGFIREMTE